MKIAQFIPKGTKEPRLGKLDGDVIVDITKIAPTALDLINQGAAALQKAKDFKGRTTYPRHAVKYLPAINAGKVIAIGRNYVDHAIEGGSEPPKSPMIFCKFTNSLTGHNQPVKLHKISEKIDFEAELAVVIGRRATKVSQEKALSYVFGYSCLHDVSARDLQFADGQWVRGKGLDGFCPLGPFITTKDEIRNPQTLNIQGILNGEVMQSSKTDKMIFSVAYLIHYITQGITLEPGDVIATGTPDGVGVFRNPPILLKDGDVFEVVIDKLETLRNSFVNP
jgi:2-keto-4-pentenoate hydratase/2-oxohepta-3-ene-1,7-dioic acid hydratase in catechol pathway